MSSASGPFWPCKLHTSILSGLWRQRQHRAVCMPCWHLALYDDFAWFYNRYWNEEFHGLAFPILERIWLPRLPPQARVLDVCCGTGHLAGLLTARGMRVTGIDLSEAMIAHARENVPTAAFQVAAASDFRVLGRLHRSQES